MKSSSQANKQTNIKVYLVVDIVWFRNFMILLMEILLRAFYVTEITYDSDVVAFNFYFFEGLRLIFVYFFFFVFIVCFRKETYIVQKKYMSVFKDYRVSERVVCIMNMNRIRYQLIVVYEIRF